METSGYIVTSNVVGTNFCIEKDKNRGIKNIGATIAFAVIFGTELVYSSTNLNQIELSNMSSQSYIRSISIDSYNGKTEFVMKNCYDILQVENENKLIKMKSLKQDWNGYGAPAFSEEAINLFMDIIKTVYKQPKIAPTGKASLLMQYELSDKSILAFDVSLNGAEKVYVPEGDYSKAEVEVFENDICSNINRCVEKFYGVG